MWPHMLCILCADRCCACFLYTAFSKRIASNASITTASVVVRARTIRPLHDAMHDQLRADARVQIGVSACPLLYFSTPRWYSACMRHQDEYSCKGRGCVWEVNGVPFHGALITYGFLCAGWGPRLYFYIQ